MEAGESPQHTVQRECEEEVGVTFVPESEPFYEGTWENRTLRYFVGSWSFQFQEGVRLVDGEAIGFDWCTFEDTLELDLAFRYREALLLLRKKKLL
jgi:8-oxo-dGTP pyrophosphatase MutT (NUDIX family)